MLRVTPFSSVRLPHFILVRSPAEADQAGGEPPLRGTQLMRCVRRKPALRFHGRIETGQKIIEGEDKSLDFLGHIVERIGSKNPAFLLNQV